MSQDEDQSKQAADQKTPPGDSSPVKDTPKRRYRGKKFGRYTLLQRIAHGGMGEIFLARQSGHGGFSKLVAIKRILSHYSSDDDHVRMFFDEAKLQAILNERHIVQIYDMGKVGEHLFICMEYVHGISMRRLIRRLRKRELTIHPAYACELMEQVCRGLSYAHNVSNSQGQKLQIVHRDINPQNLLISFDGEVKIIDFGIAKSEMSEVKTESGTLKGKFTYMSPEQGSGLPLDRRSDIFSVGICLYELLTGINPFKRANLVLSLAAIQQEEPAPLQTHRDDLPYLEPVLKLALDKNKENRFQDCADLAEALQNLIRTGKCGSPPEPFNQWVKGLFKEEIEEHLSLLEQMGSNAEIAVHSGPAIGRTTHNQLIDSASLLFADDETNSQSERIPDASQLSEDDDNSSSDISASGLYRQEDSDSSISQSAQKKPGTDTTKTGIQVAPEEPVPLPPFVSERASFGASVLPGIAAGLFLGTICVLMFWGLRSPVDSDLQPATPTTGAPSAINSDHVLPANPPTKKGTPNGENQIAAQGPINANDGGISSASKQVAPPVTDGQIASDATNPDEANDESPTQQTVQEGTAAAETGKKKSTNAQEAAKSTKRKTASKSASRKSTSKKSVSSRQPSAKKVGKLSMRASGGYKFSGKTFRNKASGALAIRESARKVLRVRGTDKPFKIDLQVKEKNQKVSFSVKSDPWAIVQVNDRSHGKSPTSFSISPGTTLRVLFKNPKAGSVKLSFKWTLQD